MKHLITLCICLLLGHSSLLSQTKDEFYISMGNASGNYQNPNVAITNPGPQQGGATYNSSQKAITNTGDGTQINIRNLDFGSGRYGWYNRIAIEYTLDQAVEEGYFDVFLDNSTYAIATIEVSNTSGSIEVLSSSFNINVIGSHSLSIKWREQSASLKSVTLLPLKPVATVNAVKSSSPLQYKFSYSHFPLLEGTHNVTMVWKNQSAKVYAVYLDKGENLDIEIPQQQNDCDILTKGNVLHIISKQPLKYIQIFTPTGTLIENRVNTSLSPAIELQQGIYIVKILMADGRMITKKTAIVQ